MGVITDLSHIDGTRPLSKHYNWLNVYRISVRWIIRTLLKLSGKL